MAKALFDIALDEVSLVDDPANPGARVTLYKRDTLADDVAVLVAKYTSALEADDSISFKEELQEQLERRDWYRTHEAMWPLMDALTTSVTETVKELSGAERDNQLRTNVEDFMTAVKDTLAAIESEPNPGLAKTAGLPGTTTDGKEGNMPTVEELQKQVGDLEKQVASLTKARDKAEADFAKAVEAGDLEVTKADNGEVTVAKRAAPEMVTVNGVQVAKASIPEPVLKTLHDQEARIAEIEKANESARLEKRAAAELPNLAGTDIQKGRLLKAVDGIADEADRTAVLSALKAADGAVSAMFKSTGRNPKDDESSATYKLDALVQKYRADNPGKTKEQAFAEVYKTAEGRKLRQEAASEQRAAN